MKLAVRRTSAALAAFATVGVSSLFVGAAPASAAVGDVCGAAGTLVAPGICEATFTSGAPTFTATADMTKLEVLLVGAGGEGAVQDSANTDGYAAAGGGGQVRVVDFTGTVGAVNLVVATPGTAGTSTVPAGTPGTPSSATAGAVTEIAANGGNASFDQGSGGNSGIYFGSVGGGAGAAGNAPSASNGGPGVIVDTIAGAGSLFDGDTECYGGGGAAGSPTVKGTPGCNAGGVTPGTELSPAVANRGGGGGGITLAPFSGTGAAGFIAVRWAPAASVVIAFSANGHGSAPASQTVATAGTATRPADPSADGYRFNGWFTDATLTTPVDFSAPVTASATYYASWSALLAATGSDMSPLPLGASALLLGGLLAFVAYRRRPRTN